MDQGELFRTISVNLQPERPIRTPEFLRGRIRELEDAVRELKHFHGIPFIFGHRGVGKTSLARTAAQLATSSDREHIYVACAPGSRMLEIFREVGENLLELAIRLGAKKLTKQKIEAQISINPYIKSSIENELPELEEFKDVNVAVRTLKGLDEIIPGAESTIVVIDELEELTQEDRNALSFLIKQIGDQEFSIRFLLVGIAENVHELIGTHESVPRYITEIPLQPLIAQDLIDIVQNASKKLDISVSNEILYKIASIGNGFPYFAHLIGKSILVEAVNSESSEVTPDIYKEGIRRAVTGSLQELKVSYEAATQRGEDYFKHLIWSLAEFDVVDVRINEWTDKYKELAQVNHWKVTTSKKISAAVGNFRQQGYGNILRHTPAKYGSAEKRYRYYRFSNPLMKGHVRLQAELEGTSLGQATTL